MSELFAYLPPYYTGSTESRTIQEAIQPEIDGIWTVNDELRLQLNPYTATWGLALWEQAFGIPVNEGKVITARRSLVVAKIRGVGTTTVEMLRSVVSRFFGGMVTIIEHPRQSHVEFRFTSESAEIPLIREMIETLQEIMPAHLGYTLNFVYPTETMIGAGCAMGMLMRLPIPELADSFDFSCELRTGGMMTARANIPIPEREDEITFTFTERAGVTGSIHAIFPVTKIS